jgi:hypothetical protein
MLVQDINVAKISINFECAKIIRVVGKYHILFNK